MSQNHNDSKPWQKDLEQAIALHKKMQLDDATAKYQDIIEKYPQADDAIHAYAILLTQTENYTQAENLFKQAIELDKTSSLYLTSYANLNIRMRRWFQAEKNLLKAISINPSSAAIYNTLGNCFFQQDKLIKAKNAYNKALKIDNQFPDALYNIANILLQKNKTDEAKQYLEQCINSYPKHAPALAMLAHMALHAKNFQKAIELATQSIQYSQQDPEVFHTLAVAYLETGKITEAIDLLLQIIEHNPNHADAKYHLATGYMRQANHDEALKYYLQHIDIQPDIDSYYNIGVIMMYKERHKDAIEYFQHVLSIDENYLQAQQNLGALFLKLGKTTTAKKHYQAILNNNPDDEEIKYILAAISKKDPPDKAPQQYLQHLFDEYAGHFDEHLTHHLQYRTPQNLWQAIEQNNCLPDNAITIMDLGCGTGLMGLYARPYASKLYGIDASQKMLDVATTKKLYDELIQGDIHDVLATYHNLELIIAADVFTYIGNLAAITKVCYDSLSHSGILAFSTEISFEDDYILQPNIRYAHNKKYILACLKQNNYNILSIENTILRFENEQPVEGYLVIARKT